MLLSHSSETCCCCSSCLLAAVVGCHSTGSCHWSIPCVVVVVASSDHIPDHWDTTVVAVEGIPGAVADCILAGTVVVVVDIQPAVVVEYIQLLECCC